MKVPYTAAIAVLTLSLSLPIAPAPAIAQVQASDAYVLRPGQLRLQAGAVYAGYDERFGADGSEPLAAPLRQPLTASSFAPLQPLSTGLTDFLAATASVPGASGVVVDASTLTLGTPDLRLFESLIRVPIELSIGILPRVELGFAIPVLRGEQLVERFTLPGGTVGANPDPAANAAALAGIGAQWEALGGSAFLPVAGSALGEELQFRVGALTGGGSLQLPAAPGDTAILQQQLVTAFGVPGVRSRVDRPRIGDAEVLARVRLYSSFGAAPVPVPAEGAHFRSALLLGIRLPTGSEPDTVELLPLPYDLSRSGYSAGVVNDLFVGDRFWATMGVRFASYGSEEIARLVTPAAAPLSVLGPPAGVRFTPGSELEVRVAPRVRLVEEISLGVEYGWTRVGGARLEGGGAMDQPVGVPAELPGGSGQKVGVGLRYSTLAAAEEGRSRVPVEFELRYQRLFAGPVGAPDTGYATVEMRVLPRLWGR